MALSGMRTVTSGELDTLLHDRTAVPHVRVEVLDAGSTWRDLSTLLGKSWLVSVVVDCERLDQAVSTATIQVRRDGPVGTSVAPLMQLSPANIVAAVYAPLFDVGTFIRVLTCVLPQGTDPVDADFRPIFDGRIDEVAWAADPLTLTCSDAGAWLMDTQIETSDVYGTTEGVPVESVMQEILDAWPSVLGTVPLEVPDSPAWFIRRYTQDRVKVLEALRALAQQIGWDVRFRYNATHDFELTLFELDRAATDADITLAANQYLDIRQLNIRLDDIRNVVRVPYFDVDGDPQFEEDNDAASVTKLGRRYMEIQEASTSNIDTSTEATRLVDAVLNDLVSPPFATEIEMRLFWPALQGTIVEVLPNDAHFDVAQKFAVVGVRHSYADGVATTTLTAAGTIRGAYQEWLRRAVPRQPVQRPFLNARLELFSTFARITFTGGPTVRGELNGGAPVAVTSPLDIARNAFGGENKAYTLRAYIVAGRDDEQNQSFTIPAQLTAPAPDPALSSLSTDDTTYPGDGAGTVEVAWTEANMPGGHKINIFISLSAGATPPPSGSNQAEFQALNVGASPYMFNIPLGPAVPAGTIVVQAVDSSDNILTQASITTTFTV